MSFFRSRKSRTEYFYRADGRAMQIEQEHRRKEERRRDMQLADRVEQELDDYDQRLNAAKNKRDENV